MTRRVSYPWPHERAENVGTDERHEDCSRGTTWTREEKNRLWTLYGRFPVKLIAEMLRRSPLSCRLQIHRMRHGRSDRNSDYGNVSRLAAE